MDSDTVTWIGTAFSILGAGIAIWQARRARSAAKRAEDARKEIVGRVQHGELGALDGVLAAACKAMDKYGPGRTEDSLIGTEPNGDGDAVRAFTAGLDRNRELLTKVFGNSCDDVRDRINNLLADFAAAGTVKRRLSKGREIYLEITTFSGNMKNALDNKAFQPNAALD